MERYDQNVGVLGAAADKIEWTEHVEEFRSVRLSTIMLFRNMPIDAWRRSGIVSDSLISVRALAFIIAGHCGHHIRILCERYLRGLED